MNKLSVLRNKIESGKFPQEFPEFGGANLIITSDQNRRFHEGDVVVYSIHAPALSWLVTELKNIYADDLNYLNKYDFYPKIGMIINKTLINQGLLFETMFQIIDQIENEWGEQ